MVHTFKNSDPTDPTVVHLQFMLNKQRELLGLPPHKQDVEDLYQTEKAGNLLQRYEPQDAPDPAEPSEYMDEDEDSADDVGSPAFSSMEGLFTPRSNESYSPSWSNQAFSPSQASTPRQVTPVRSSSALQEFHPANEFASPGPSSASHHPSPTPDQELLPQPVPLHAPIPSYPIFGNHHFRDQEILKGERAYNILSTAGPSNSHHQTVPDESGALSYAMGSDAPWLAAGVNDFPGEPVGDRFMFHSEGYAPLHQSTWNIDTTFVPQCDPQLTLPPHAFDLPHYQPEPTLGPAPPQPTPVSSNLGPSYDDSENLKWKNIAKIIEGDPRGAIVPRQEPSFLQQTVTALGLDQPENPLHRRLVSVERIFISFAPP